MLWESPLPDIFYVCIFVTLNSFKDKDNVSKHKIEFLNDDVIYWRKKAIQPHLALCEKVIAPLDTKSTNSPNLIDNLFKFH